MKFFVNFLSAFRIIASFIIPITMVLNMPLTTFILFILAALSDFFDGFLARKYNVCTKLGTVLDSIADKFLIINTFIMLCIFMRVWFIGVPIILMISRELYISGLREFVGAQNKTPPHAKNRFSMGKVKTAMQMIAIIAFLGLFTVGASIDASSNGKLILYAIYALPNIGIFSLWFALTASIWSATEYTIDVIKKFKK